MSDYTAMGDLHHVKPVNKVEYFVYFSLILCLIVVPHLIGWIYQTIRHARLPENGPMKRAFLDAQLATPMIFRR